MTTIGAPTIRPAGAPTQAGAHPPLQLLDDQHLVQRHLEGDPRAFGALVDRYQPRLHEFIGSGGDDRERVEELVQQVFVRVFRHLRRVDPTKDLATWIYGIAANLVRDNPRQRGRDPLLPGLE
ncbi:MAG TPA: sigma factor [Gemmatimonadales bacterium]|nr:sigma factor [Gemmatimonadales bacterium]